MHALLLFLSLDWLTFYHMIISLLYLSKFTRFLIYFLLHSDDGPMLETLDYTIRIGSTPTILYFDLYLYFALRSTLRLYNQGGGFGHYQRTGNNFTIHWLSKVNMKYEKSWVPMKNYLNNQRDAIERVRMYVFNLF